MSWANEKMKMLKSSIGDIEILDETKTSDIEELIMEKIVFIPPGRINWNSYPDSISVTDINEVVKNVHNKNCYIMWDEGTLPIVKANLDSIGDNMFEVTKIAFDTWIVGDSFDWVIEFHHSGLVNYTELN